MIKLILFTIQVMDCNFLNLGGCYNIRYKSFLTIFSLKTQQIEVRLVAIKSAYFSPYAYTPFHFLALYYLLYTRVIISVCLVIVCLRNPWTDLHQIFYWGTRDSRVPGEWT